MIDKTQPAGQQRIDALIPAGGRIYGAFAQRTGTGIKALIRLGGETLLAKAISTLRQTEAIGNIAVVGPPSVLAEAQHAGLRIAERGSGHENVLAGLRSLREHVGSERVCVLSSDLPFISPAALTAFLSRCPDNEDITAAVVSKRAFETRFPSAPAVFVPLRGGAVTLGCAFVVKPDPVIRNEMYLQRAFTARKSQWAMARLAGGSIAARFAVRRLSHHHLAARASRVLRCSCGAAVEAPAELAFDIDEEADYLYAARSISGEPQRHD
ncbi:MAG TPA: nucleotidyltransferase family protein [Chthonomonadales bacterium]|nr:nucleotidyltransferase family protein [Chthonomonadales bacterium]